MGGHFLFIISCYQWLADPLCWLQIGYKNSKDAMENEKIRSSLEEEGDDLSIPRSIDHFLSFNSEEDRDAFRAEAASLGFAAELDSGAHRAEGSYCLRLTREDRPPARWPQDGAQAAWT